MNSGVRKLVFTFLLLGLSFAAYVYMIKPANKTLKEQKQMVHNRQVKLQELEAATATAKDLSKQLERVEEAISVFESKLPPSSEIHKVLESVTVIAQKNGLTPKTISTLKQNNNSGYVDQPLKMELHGNFRSYYSFLLELEKLDRITRIRELTIKKRSKHEGYTEATFVVSIFFQNIGV